MFLNHKKKCNGVWKLKMKALATELQNCSRTKGLFKGEESGLSLLTQVNNCRFLQRPDSLRLLTVYLGFFLCSNSDEALVWMNGGLKMNQ